MNKLESNKKSKIIKFPNLGRALSLVIFSYLSACSTVRYQPMSNLAEAGTKLKESQFKGIAIVLDCQGKSPQIDRRELCEVLGEIFELQGAEIWQLENLEESLKATGPKKPRYFLKIVETTTIMPDTKMNKLFYYLSYTFYPMVTRAYHGLDTSLYDEQGHLIDHKIHAGHFTTYHGLGYYFASRAGNLLGTSFGTSSDTAKHIASQDLYRNLSAMLQKIPAKPGEVF